MINIFIEGNNVVAINDDGVTLLDHPRSLIAGRMNTETGTPIFVAREHNSHAIMFQSALDQITIEGNPVDQAQLETWYRTNLGFNPGGSASSPTDQFVTFSQLAVVQAQLDEAEIIARSDTLQPGETIADTGTLFDAAGRRWETLNDNAVVPDPLTIAALEASPDFKEAVPPAEIFTRLSAWQRVNDAGIVQQGEIGGVPTAILTDLSELTSHYRSSNFLPLTSPHTVKLRIHRDPLATTSIMLRTRGVVAGVGSQELIINLDTGDAFGDSSGDGVVPVIEQTQITDDEIIVWATFQPNVGITQWDLFPAIGTNEITDGTGFVGATQGTLEIFELDLNSERSGTSLTT